jgi:hypothetical protein
VPEEELIPFEEEYRKLELSLLASSGHPPKAS